MNDFTIRAMVADDMDTVWTINQENVPAVGEETIEVLTGLFAISTISLVAEVDKAIVGFCIVLSPTTTYQSPNYRYFCERFDDFIYLDRVAVTSDYQGWGIGAAMYRKVEHLSDASIFVLEVNTKPRNEGSLRFHVREGFELLEELETRPGKLVAFMMKKLKG
jgi:predicted GNAT superfamily acetyltransferase